MTCLLHQHNPPTSKLIDVRHLAASLTSAALGILHALLHAFFLSQQNGEDFDRRIETESICTAPAGKARDADAGSELRGEVEVAEDLLMER